MERLKPINRTVNAYVSNIVASTVPTTLLGLTVTNSAVTAQYIQLHNTQSLPADDEIPVLPIRVEALSSLGLDFGVYGREFTQGLVVCNSSTGPTKTIGAADCWFDVQLAAQTEIK